MTYLEMHNLFACKYPDTVEQLQHIYTVRDQKKFLKRFIKEGGTPIINFLLVFQFGKLYGEVPKFKNIIADWNALMKEYWKERKQNI